ncbi:cytochrome bd-I oxidase subunit CydX [Methylocella sp.]
MWYFTWILGVGAALAAGIINVMWYEFHEAPDASPAPDGGAGA